MHHASEPRRLLAALFLLVAASTTTTRGSESSDRDETLRPWRFPETDAVASSLEQRAAEQKLKSLAALSVAADFTFRDQVVESGIDFVHRIVEDGGRYYKMSHWDHGNGLTVADVDSDGLPDLYFPNQIGANELWRNLGGGRFENWTEKAGVAMADRISVTAAFADVDNDGDPDLFVTTVRQGVALFENLGEGVFRDRADVVALQQVPGHASAPVFFDVDLDGRLDLLLVAVGSYTTDERGAGGYYVGRDDAFAGHLFPERAERSRIYRNLGDWKFEDVSDALGFRDESWSGDALITDVDLDGYPDVYLLNMQGDDHFWRNDSGKKLVEESATYFPRTSWGSMGAVLLDHDGNGALDIYVTDMHSDMSEEVGPEREALKSRMQWPESQLQGGANNLFGNSFFVNQGEGKFEEASDRLGVETYWPWGVSSGDLNADGWEDLFVTSSMNFPWRYQVNKTLLNNAGEGFVEAEFLLGIEPRLGGHTYAPWFELDCNDSVVDRRHVLCGQRPGQQLLIEGTLGSRASVVVDLDADGDQDIVTSNFNSAPQVLLSDLAQTKKPRWLEVELRGTHSNRDGFGARIELVVGDRTLVRYRNGKVGYLSQGSTHEYFGLGDAKRAQEIRVQWPSGCSQVVAGPHRSGRLVTVTENCGSRATQPRSAP